MTAEDNNWYAFHQYNIRKPISNNKSIQVVISKNKPIGIS